MNYLHDENTNQGSERTNKMIDKRLQKLMDDPWCRHPVAKTRWLENYGNIEHRAGERAEFYKVTASKPKKKQPYLRGLE